MSDDFLGDRRKALEDSFFAKENRKLLDRMRAEREKANAVEALARQTKIKDTAVLERMVELGIDPATWAALSLVPLVEVAWADGEVQSKEREAILAAAAEQGIAPGSASHSLLESWLAQRPDASLFATWGEYSVGLAAQLSPAERRAVRDDLSQRARKVAETAGGFLGIGRVSDAEERVLAELEKPFA